MDGFSSAHPPKPKAGASEQCFTPPPGNVVGFKGLQQQNLSLLRRDLQNKPTGRSVQFQMTVYIFLMLKQQMLFVFRFISF
jgi:hypothetical protein